MTPPFQVPDEVGHYWRAYTIARGEIIPSMLNGRPSAAVPLGVRQLVANLWLPTAGRPELKVGWSRLRAAVMIPLDRSDPVAVTVAAHYTPVPYSAAALGCWIGDTFDMRPLFSFYLGRLLNAFALLILIYASMQRLQSGGFVIAAVGLLPMTLYLAGSYSPDAITIGMACYVTALVLNPQPGRRYWFSLFSSAFILSLCKPVYFLLPMVAIVASWSERKRNFYRYAGVVAAVIAGVGISAATARRGYFPMRTDIAIDTAAQMTYVEAHPQRFVLLAVRDYVEHSAQYADHFVGHLGWLDIQLPKVPVAIVFVSLMIVGLLTPGAPNLATRIAAWAVILVSCLLISLSQYLVWTRVGANAIEGMQGRYLLPLAPLALKTIGLRGAWTVRAERWTVPLFLALVVALDLIGLAFVVRRYY